MNFQRFFTEFLHTRRRAAGTGPTTPGGRSLQAAAIDPAQWSEGGRITPVAAFALFIAFLGVFTTPPLDRDEARFAQATAQMLETGDFIRIRFQDEERNKKPAGIHWLQAASVGLFSSAEARQIWAFRLPSVAGAAAAAIFTYLAGARLFGVGTGFLAALLLASAPSFAGESMIAKTDAVLLASVCAAQFFMIEIIARTREGRRVGPAAPAGFWFAVAGGVLIKGPVTPMVVGLTALAFWFSQRDRKWARAMRPFAGLAIVAACVAPWAILIGLETGGRFYADAIGGDMLGKVGAAQERHSGPPGYHLLLVWLLFWPAAAMLPRAIANALQDRGDWRAGLLLAWVFPSWLVFELTATKLPHYTLPLYPALAILCAQAAAGGDRLSRDTLRRLGAGLYAAVGLLAVAGVIALIIAYSPEKARALQVAGALPIVGVGACAARWFWRRESLKGAYGAVATSALLAILILQVILPGLERLQVSARIAEALEAAGRHPVRNGAPATALSGYYEPSAVFLLGTGTRLTDGGEAARYLLETPGAAAAVEAREEDAFRKETQRLGISVAPLAVVDGLNYSNGDDVAITIHVRASE